jgi:hypothetical protein
MPLDQLRPLAFGPGTIEDLNEGPAHAGASGGLERAEARPGLERAGRPRPGVEPEFPLDLRLARPRALDILKLYALAGQAVPGPIAAALGERLPILLVHGMTAFQRPGERPRGIWGMGYDVQVDVDADTVAVEPGTAHFEVGSINQQMLLKVSASGALDTGLLGAGPALPIALPGAQLHASTDQSFSLSLQYTLRVLKVQAGRVGAGGARWNFYEQDEPLDGEQTMFQSLMLRKETKAFRATVSSWVRSRGFLGFGSVLWKSAPEEFDISLE